MDNAEPRLLRNAWAIVLFPILGMAGGLLAGIVTTWVRRFDEFVAIELIVRWGFLGSLFGAATAVMAAFLARRNISTVKRLSVVIVAGAIVAWAVVMLLRSLSASGVLH
jgi:hypothetical protein